MIRYKDATTNRLIWVDKAADEEFWDAQWVRENDIEVKALHAQEMVQTTKRYLSAIKDHKIIEGGCGNGGVVLALQRAGYDVLGVDYAQNTVQRLNKEHPELSIQEGDVRNLSNIKDASYHGYWSLGVIEHFWTGYHEIINEAHRILKPGGHLFLTFPWYSPLRKIKTALNIIPKYSKNSEPEGFYQFSLSQNNVAQDLQRAGFIIEKHYARSGLHGLDTEWPWTRSIRNVLAKALDRKAKSSSNQNNKNTSTKKISGKKQKLGLFLDRALAPFLGHSYIIIARKREN